MEIRNINDAKLLNNVKEIIQLCECSYNNKVVDFRIINNELGLIEDIEYKNGDEWSYEYEDKITDNDIEMIVGAIDEAFYEVFHKKDIGATMNMNHISIKENPEPAHFPSDYYVDAKGPILFTLKKNIVVTNEE